MDPVHPCTKSLRCRLHIFPCPSISGNRIKLLENFYCAPWASELTVTLTMLNKLWKVIRLPQLTLLWLFNVHSWEKRVSSLSNKCYSYKVSCNDVKRCSLTWRDVAESFWNIFHFKKWWTWVVPCNKICFHISFHLYICFQNFISLTQELKLSFRCQSYDVIVPPKTPKNEKQKTYDFLEKHF